MKKLLLLLLMAGSAWASNFTPFYLISGSGDNLNSGSTPDAAANTTYVSKVVANGWDASTGIFTVAAGNPTSDTGVTNGAFASIYVTAGATVATFIARITNTTTTTFSVDLKGVSGSAPATDATGATTAKVGGAWIGPPIPQTTVNFPFGFVSGSMTNGSGNCPMINTKGSWWVTNTLVESGNNGPVWWRGYTNTIGDGGFANIYGSNGIAAYNLLAFTGGKNRAFSNFQFATNGNSGGATTQYGVYMNSTEDMLYNCVVHDMWISGIGLTANSMIVSCEAYNCDLANSASFGGISSSTAGAFMFNCFSHHNTNVNAAGFQTDGSQIVYNCISATNGADGFRGSGDVQLALVQCASYGNRQNGINYKNASGLITDPMNIVLQNCSIVNNGSAGITNEAAGQGYYSGVYMNNGFGSGTMANVQGDIEAKLQGVIVLNSVTFTANQTPWNAPATGDFSITSATAGAKGAGYGTYVQTYPGYGGTVAYPDIGAAQASSTNTGGGGGTVGYGFAQ